MKKRLTKFYLPGSYRPGVPELVDLSYYLYWLNSGAPARLFKLLFPKAPSILKADIIGLEIAKFQLKQRLRAKIIAQLLTDAIPNDIADNSRVVYPLAGADFVSPFLIPGVNIADLCDMAPVFSDSVTGITNAYDFISRLKEQGFNREQFLFGTGNGFDAMKHYDNFNGGKFATCDRYPVGYLGLLRLKLLLGAQDIQISKMPGINFQPSSGYTISFTVNGQRKYLNYFAKVEFPVKVQSDLSQTTKSFLQHLTAKPPNVVLLKGSIDFTFIAESFWNVVGAGVPVVTDQICNYGSGLWRSKDGDMETIERLETQFQPLNTANFPAAAGKFGYAKKAYLYSSDGLSNISQKYKKSMT